MWVTNGSCKTISSFCCILLQVYFGVQLFSSTVASLRCGPGEYLSNDTCKSCTLGTFISHENHHFTRCNSCTPARTWLREVIVQSCNITSDTKIGCEKGYYRKKTGHPDLWECERCTKCAHRQTFEARECSPDSDAICCPQPAMTLQAGPDGSPVCMASPVDPNTTSIKCYKGTFLSFTTSNIPTCSPCTDRTFMPDDLHSSVTCRACLRVKEDRHEIELASCTKTEDTVLGCATGYYRNQNSMDENTCLPCSACEGNLAHEAQPCSQNSDTICCPEQDMNVVKDSRGVSICVHKPRPVESRLCHKGQYLEHDGQGQPKCRPCKEGTYMPVARHVNLSCKPCTRVLPELREVEVAKCTPTTDTVIMCQQGYFFEDQRYYEARSNLEIRFFSRGCQKCSSCKHTVSKYEGRPCSNYTDTVCCPESGMTVTEDANGHVSCTKLNSSDKTRTHCGRGRFLHAGKSGRTSCRPCPHGSFMPEDKHNSSLCYPCTQANATNNEKVIKNCTISSDTKIDSKDIIRLNKSRTSPLAGRGRSKQVEQSRVKAKRKGKKHKKMNKKQRKIRHKNKKEKKKDNMTQIVKPRS